jgi:hypothetical protein
MDLQSHWNDSCLNVHASPQFNSAVKGDSDFRIAEPKLKDDPIMDIIESAPQTYEFRNSSLKDENSSNIDFSLSTSSSESSMEIKLGPTKVQHEADHIPLFPLSNTTPSEATTLLSGLRNTSDSPRSQHLQDIVLTFYNKIIIGHAPDSTRDQRADIMLFNMGLVMPRSPIDTNTTSNLDIKYGSTLVHFFRYVNREVPLNWQVLYLFLTPSKSSISCQTNSDNFTNFNSNNKKVDPESAVIPSCPFSPVTPILISELKSSDDNNRDEVDIPCTSCLNNHNYSYASPTTISISRTGLPINCGIKFGSRLRTSNSLPFLCFLSDSFDLDSGSNSKGEDDDLSKLKMR